MIRMFLASTVLATALLAHPAIAAAGNNQALRQCLQNANTRYDRKVNACHNPFYGSSNLSTIQECANNAYMTYQSERRRCIAIYG